MCIHMSICLPMHVSMCRCARAQSEDVLAMHVYTDGHTQVKVEEGRGRAGSRETALGAKDRPTAMQATHPLPAMSLHMSMHMSTHMPIHMSVHMSVHMSACMCVRMSM